MIPTDTGIKENNFQSKKRRSKNGGKPVMPTDTENNCQKVGFYTLGCKVNQYESNGMIQKFKEAGYEVVAFEDYADIYIVNTCTVTNESDRKCRQIIRRAKQHNKNAILIVVRLLCRSSKKRIREDRGYRHNTG